MPASGRTAGLDSPEQVHTLLSVRHETRSQARAAAADVLDCACFNTRKAARALTQLYDEMLRPSGLRTTQFTLLMVLRGRGPTSINNLAEATVTDRTTLTRNLAILEGRGLVRIRPGEDARVRMVELTNAGDEAASAAYPLWQKAQAMVARRMGEDRLGRLLADLSRAVGAATDG
jgi:DNA-binding MarR family transcriptional regulator